MTTNHGLNTLEPLRKPDTYPRPAGALAARRELRARTCPRTGGAVGGRTEGATEPRGRWHRCSPLSRTNPCLSNRPAIFRPGCAQAISPPPDRARAGSSATDRSASPPPAPHRQAAVTLSERSSLGAVAAAVAGALRSHGIPAVLTGGACATLYSEGAYHSRDLDFIVIGEATRAGMNRAMGSIGFGRKGDRYVHSRARFYVEFPRGPLAIGGDYRIRPVSRSTPHGSILMLSATDSCRDRLAAFYHWGDRQSLTVAAWIAARNRVNLPTLRRWSAAEGMMERFREFLAEIKRVRRRMAPDRARR